MIKLLRRNFFVALIVSFIILPGTMVHANESNGNQGNQGNQINQLIDEVYFEQPQNVSPQSNTIDSFTVSIGTINSMSNEELIKKIQEFTSWDNSTCKKFIDNIKYSKKTSISSDSSAETDSSIASAPIYDIRRVTEWVTTPYVTKTEKWVTFSSSWIGIDAYRSAVGMSKGREEEKTVTTTLGYSGDSLIKTYLGLTLEFSSSQTTTISENQTCPGWTTMNWRPYIAFYKDYYYGRQTSYTKITDVATGKFTISDRTYSDYNGQNNRLITKTTEVWSRVNATQDITALTPLPPTGPPMF